MKLTDIERNALLRIEASERVEAMGNLDPSVTFLKKNTWVWINPNSTHRHGPRLKVSNRRGTFSKEDNFSVLF